MSRRKKIGITAYIMFFALLLSGCGKAKYEAPELLEPVAVNESYRPVEYGDIGDKQIEYARVAATDTCYFWETSAAIERVAVSVGDYVQPGDVLAYADLDEARKRRDAVARQLAQENALFEQNNQIYSYKHKEYEYKIQGAEELGETAVADGLCTALAVLEENQSYDEKLHAYHVSQLNKQTSEIDELLADSVLVAKSAGMVTYVKNITDSNSVSNSENVVVVSDLENRYIEVSGMNVSKQSHEKLEKLDRIYAEINGTRYPLTEREYTPEELAVAENVGAFPNIRFDIEDNSLLPEVGSNIPIFMSKGVAENVLMIGKDSLCTDSQGYFVYVDEDGHKEIRRITIGKRDNQYIEVTGGLSEGELVAYSSSAMLPDEYTEVTLLPETYDAMVELMGNKIVDSKDIVFYSDYEGEILSIDAGTGKKVNKGDLICTIQTYEGSARIAELSNQMDSLKENYTNQTDALDEQISALEEQLEQLANPPEAGENTAPEEAAEAVTATDTDAAPSVPQDPYLQDELSCQIQQLKCAEQIAALQYNYQLSELQRVYREITENNNGAGVISIYADRDGTVKNIKVHEGQVVKVGTRLYDIEVDVPKSLLIIPNKQHPTGLNQTVEFKSEESDKVFYGKVIGTTGGDGKVYITTKGDHVYLTTNIATCDAGKNYVAVDSTYYDSSERFKISYSVTNITDSIILNIRAVYTETVMNNEYKYVWRVVDGRLVKQYVTVMDNPVSNMPVACIITGLKPGDVIAAPKEEVDEDDSTD